MNKIININNLKQFCYLNDDLVKDNPIGLIIEFRGLGAQTMFAEYPQATIYSKNNILYMIPYLNPWNWMNKQACQEVEEIIEVIKEKYQIEELKIASTGGSMGGLSALTYSAYAKTKPSIVVANCPVCDLEYHFHERNDLPRTLYSAFYNEENNKDFFEYLNEYSPITLAGKNMLPHTKYVIFHCSNDSQVNIDKHTRILYNEMKEQYDLEFIIVKDKDHCALDSDAVKYYEKCLLDTFLIDKI